MAKVTSKLQVTVPKAVADRVGIRAGDEIEWVVEGEAVRVYRVDAARALTVAERLALFDAATHRQRQRDAARRRQPRSTAAPKDRGWTRDDLYTRARTR